MVLHGGLGLGVGLVDVGRAHVGAVGRKKRTKRRIEKKKKGRENEDNLVSYSLLLVETWDSKK